MDGNGRWALRSALPRFAGHQAGAEALRTVVEAAPACGITTLTAYAFSSDNWKRPSEEVAGLMGLIADYLEGESTRLVANGVRLSAIGRRDRLPSRLGKAIAAAEEATMAGCRLHFQLAIDYSAREAIVRAIQLAGSKINTPETLAELLGASEPVDLLIRTGGEQRLSDFLLWECAYAELLFTTCMWPDFNAVELRKAISSFRRRDRRFGAVTNASMAYGTTGRMTVRDRWLH